MAKVPLTATPSGLVKARSVMAPWLTEMVTGAVGEISAAPKAGLSATFATGGGGAVVLGAAVLGSVVAPDGTVPLPALAGWPAAAPAGLTPADCTSARPPVEPEQAAVRASPLVIRPAIRPVTSRERPERCNGMLSSEITSAGRRRP